MLENEEMAYKQQNKLKISYEGYLQAFISPCLAPGSVCHRQTDSELSRPDKYEVLPSS